MDTITVKSNTIYDDRATPLGYAAVSIVDAGGDAPTNVLIEGNPMASAWTGGKGVAFAAGMRSTTATVRDNPGNDDTARGATVYSAAVQSIPNATLTTLTFDTAPVNSVDMVEGGTAMWVVGSPSRVTMKEAGRVRVTGQVCFAANGTGLRQLNLMMNGANVKGGGRASALNIGAAAIQNVNIASGIIDVVAGDYFELQAFQDSGGALNTSGGITQTWLSVEVL